MKIFYVHHALRDKGNPPTQEDGLKELGVEDAKLVAQIFEGYKEFLNFRAIYTSPYFRCKETARLINETFNLPIYDEPRFNEFIAVHYAVKGVKGMEATETWAECQTRIQDAIKDIVNKYDEGNKKDAVICVTSGVNITAFIGLAYRISANENLPFPWVPSCSPIGFEIDKSFFKE